MDINFIEFKKEHLPLYYQWAEMEHVKSEWFRDGYQKPDIILTRLNDNQNKDAFPFIIEVDGHTVGFIQYYILTAKECGIRGFKEKTIGFDIFIGDNNYIGKGYGTEVVKKFADKLLTLNGIQRVITDPFTTNMQAIRCYEKAGFKPIGKEVDKIGTEVLIMELKK